MRRSLSVERWYAETQREQQLFRRQPQTPLSRYEIGNMCENQKPNVVNLYMEKLGFTSASSTYTYEYMINVALSNCGFSCSGNGLLSVASACADPICVFNGIMGQINEDNPDDQQKVQRAFLQYGLGLSAEQIIEFASTPNYNLFFEIIGLNMDPCEKINLMDKIALYTLNPELIPDVDNFILPDPNITPIEVPVIDNGITILNIQGQQDVCVKAKQIAETVNRGNTEDLLSGLNGNDTGIISFGNNDLDAAYLGTEMKSLFTIFSMGPLQTIGYDLIDYF
ncbi:MAG: hypothetical protein IPL35_01725 [Sphingobacteriales bacterium]|nr:hypothetical protein [Sphingobacteriales bacterium]